MRTRTVVALAAWVALVSAANAHATAFTVTRTDDPPPGACDSDCSLREAVLAVNAGSGGDTIAVRAGHYLLTRAGTAEDAAATGDLDVTKSVTIVGAGARSTVIDGVGGDRVLDVQPGVTALISDLTVTRGLLDGDGGGIRNAGALTLVRVAIVGNEVLAEHNHGGGGISSTGTLTVSRSTIARNRAHNGGGIDFGGALGLDTSTISGNQAGGPGSNGGGGGIAGSSGASLTIASSTITGNVSFNGSGSGGGISAPTAALQNTIVANNVSHTPDQASTFVDNCSVGTSTSQGNNLADGTDCDFTQSTDHEGVTVLLAPLGDNGGATDTHALPAGSAARDAGGGCPGTDQRGAPRRPSQPCDVGAYEVAPPAPTGLPATSVAATSAVLAGTFEASVQPAFYKFEYAVVGGSAGGATPPQWIAPNATAQLSARVTGLQPGTRYRFQLVGTNADGSSESAAITFTTRPDRTRPVLTLLRVAPGIFRAAKGTMISFTLSEAATTTLRFDRVLTGVRRGKHCVARKPRRRGRACTRYLPVTGSVSVQSKLGANSFRFDARVGGRRLRRGAYRLRATPQDGFGNIGKTAIAAFRLVR